MKEGKNRKEIKGHALVKETGQPEKRSKAAQVAEARAEKGAAEEERLPVIGIGASAGGLEAFELFFRNLPVDTNASFVLIQHLGPDQPSILRDLVDRFTKLPVHEASEGMKIQPNHVYVIPVKVYMALDDGILKLTERTAVRPHIPMPIDFFFRSLARERGEKAVAILLSGTGTDGTLGIRDINGAGGVTMVQEPSDSRFPGMPESAINSGHVDYVLPAAKMGDQSQAGPRPAPACCGPQAADPAHEARERPQPHPYPGPCADAS